MRLPARDIIVACLPDAHFLSLEDENASEARIMVATGVRFKLFSK